eukprot:16185307-Heterocapsa_arctica.AAC.1
MRASSWQGAIAHERTKWCWRRQTSATPTRTFASTSANSSTASWCHRGGRGARTAGWCSGRAAWQCWAAFASEHGQLRWCGAGSAPSSAALGRLCCRSRAS